MRRLEKNLTDVFTVLESLVYLSLSSCRRRLSHEPKLRSVPSCVTVRRSDDKISPNCWLTRTPSIAQLSVTVSCEETADMDMIRNVNICSHFMSVSNHSYTNTKYVILLDSPSDVYALLNVSLSMSLHSNVITLPYSF